LVDFLAKAISNNQLFDLWSKSNRNLIDIDDVYDIADEIIKSNKWINRTVNIASPVATPVPEIVLEIEKFFGATAKYNEVEKGSDFTPDISEIKPILAKLEINFDEAYLSRALEKYFSHLINGPKLVSIIVPTYNEELGIKEFYRRTKSVLEKLSPRFDHEIIFINDFSVDATREKLDELAKIDAKVKVINFSRNFGNQYGISAGIDYSSGDLAIIIDDDLQDPPEIIPNLIAKWSLGYKVVYGVRPKREGVNPLFKIAAKMFYCLIGNLSDIDIPRDTGDFRLIDGVVIDTLRGMKEENKYYRGMVAWVGFSQIGVIYERDKRYRGVSTFSFKKYVSFAMSGLTSFTDKPLYLSSLVGLIITTVSFIFGIILIAIKVLDPSSTIQGWTSLAIIVLFFCGVQLLSIGMLGIYLSKIYREVKKRPLYIVESTKNISSTVNVPPYTKPR
jgi:dolichol-phosphate mannosyltransferase